MGKPLFLGIDLGTSRLKLQVISSEGEAIADASEPINMAVPTPGWAEQDPEEWWSALVVACKALFSGGKVEPSQIESVGLSGQMHGATFLGAGGRVLRPCLIWADARTEEQVDQISRLVPRAEMIKTTGNAPNTGFTAPKILWVMQHEPQLYSKTQHILLPKDYLRYRLTGSYATDVSDASATLLFDLAERNWSPDLLLALRIDAALLPPVYESTLVTGHITEEAGRATGLAPGTPVAAGGGDAACSALGSGLLGSHRGGGGRSTRGQRACPPERSEGFAEGTEIVLSSLGTSGQVLAVTDRPVVDPGGRVHSLCYVLPDRWHVMGAILAGGLALSWLRDILAPAGSEPADYGMLAAEAAEVEAGAEGVIFVPYLLGERTPHMDPAARAAFVGLGLHHSRRHLVRAVMEGVAFALLDGLNVMKEMGIAPAEVRFAGGGGAMALWQQIQRDVFALPAYTGGADHGAAYGAAILAAISTGAFANPQEVIQRRVKGALSQPDEGNATRYRQAYALYRAVCPALRAVP